MWEAALLLLYGGTLSYVVIKALRSLGRPRIWEEAAASCSLEAVEVTSGPNRRLTARSGPVEVRIRLSGEAGRSLVAVKASGPPGFHKMRIRPQKMYQPLHEIKIGDAAFDGQYTLDGPLQLVSALLDQETRRRLSDIELSLSSSELRVSVPHQDIARVLPPLLDLGKRLSQPLDVPRRLAENATKDPMPGVRLHNLLVLARELPHDPATVEALRAARSDPSPEVRLRIGKELGAEGRGILRELAEGLEDDAVTAEAISALQRELPFERLRALLDRALSLRRLRTARACLEAIGSSADAGAVDVLAKVLEQERGELAPVAARALGATGSPAAEPPLIALLRRGKEDILVAAANALGRIGTVAAVLPLKELAERYRYLLGDVRRAARQAVAEIQSRAAGASPGQLSLAGAEAGQLSLAEGEAGQLSLAEDPAGQLSLPPGERPA